MFNQVLKYSPNITISVMIFVLINCLFWAVMDVWVFGVTDGHTILYIYLPVSLMFSFALWSWYRHSLVGLIITQRFCELIILGLTGYGLYLLSTQPIWGFVTFAFLPCFIYVHFNCRSHYIFSQQLHSKSLTATSFSE